MRKSIEVLAAAALHRKPGLVTVVEAMAEFRQDLSSGVLKMAPRDCFKPEMQFSPRHLEVLASSWIWLLSFMLSMFSSPGRREVLAGEEAWRMREDPGNSTAVLWILCVLFAVAMSVDLPFRQFGVLGQVIAFQHLLISALLPANSCNDAPPSFGGVFLGLPPWLVPSLQLHGCALGMTMVRLWQDQDLQVKRAVNEYLEGKEVPVVLSSGMDGSAVKTRIEMITDFLDGEIDFLHELLGKVQHLSTSKRAHVDWMRSVDFLLDLLTSSADVLKQTQIYTDEGEERDLQDQLSEWIGAGSRQPTLNNSPMSPMASVNESAAAPAPHSTPVLQIPGQMPSSTAFDESQGSFHSLQQPGAVSLVPPEKGDSSQFSGLQQAASAHESASVTVDPSLDPWNKDLHVRSALGVGDWNFDALNVAAQHQSVLKLVGMEILNDRPMLPKEHLPAFLETLESRYDTSQPYHSNIHAADMTNAVYFMFESCGLQERVHISETTVTCMYLAALGHDVGHPGYNNNFLINFRHDYAITYSDRSVLENFHAAELIRLLSGQVKGVNFLGSMPEQQQKQERFWMTSLILNTDMSKLMQDLSALRMKISSGTFAMEEVMGWLFRSADIGHSAKPWSIHEAWSMRVVQEFHAQGDREIQSPSMSGLMALPLAAPAVPSAQATGLTSVALPSAAAPTAPRAAVAPTAAAAVGLAAVAAGRRMARQPRCGGFAGAAKVTLKDVKGTAGRSLSDARVVVCAGVTFPEGRKLRVAVVGGGPAGASAADALAQKGVETFLIERKMDNCKPCGGAIPLCMIDEFDLPKDIVDRQVRKMTMISPTNKEVQIGQTLKDDEYIGMVRREVLDDFLRQRAKKNGATLINGLFMGMTLPETWPELEKKGDSYVMTYNDYDGEEGNARKGEKKTLEVDVVIGADGANSRVAKDIEAGDYEYAIAFQERMRIPEQKMDYYKDRAEMYVGEDVSPDFYAWVFPKCDHVAVGTGTVVDKKPDGSKSHTDV
eukprot:s645_g29.t1